MRLLTLFSTTLLGLTMAQSTNTTAPPLPPSFTLLYSMEAKLGDRFSLGPIPTGQERIVIPIVGGTFKGPRMNGMLPHFESFIL